MKLSFASVLVLTAALAAWPVSAQPPGAFGGMPAGLDPIMARFIGDNAAATFDAESTFKDGSMRQPLVTVMKMSTLDGKLRLEMDLSQTKGGKIPPNAMARMKQMGMDKMVCLSRPDKKVNYIIYPSMQAYFESPMGGSQPVEAAPGEKSEKPSRPKYDKISQGRETIDGHVCEKTLIATTDEQGKRHEVLVWQASDLHDFPVQMQATEGQHSFLIKFKNINLTKPDAQLFEAPAEFTKYGSAMELMQTEMMKRAGALRGRP